MNEAENLIKGIANGYPDHGEDTEETTEILLDYIVTAAAQLHVAAKILLEAMRDDERSTML
jgi:hypothetical protein